MRERKTNEDRTMSNTSFKAMQLHSQVEFQTWLAREVEVREELAALIGRELELTPESLDVVEAYLLEHYAAPKDLLALPARSVLDAAARQIGLVYVLNVDGAEWAINLDDPDDMYYRLPIIRLADGAAVCPLTLATACLERRTGEFLRGRVEAAQELYNDADESGKS
jgi:hypothetical protein